MFLRDIWPTSDQIREIENEAVQPAMSAVRARRRSQVLLKLACTENMLVLAVNVLAVKFWLLNLIVPLYLRVF